LNHSPKASIESSLSRQVLPDVPKGHIRKSNKIPFSADAVSVSGEQTSFNFAMSFGISERTFGKGGHPRE
jgi:hypothetical protein